MLYRGRFERHRGGIELHRGSIDLQIRIRGSTVLSFTLNRVEIPQYPYKYQETSSYLLLARTGDPLIIRRKTFQSEKAVYILSSVAPKEVLSLFISYDRNLTRRE
jgi:hypothetical protein